LNFQIIAIDARPNKLILVSAISVHESSPAVAPISPMANFSPGTHVDIPSHETHSNKKLVIGLIAASSLMGIILLPLICLWICRRKKMYKSTKINAKKLDSLRGFPLTSFIGITNSTLKPSSEKKSVAVMDYNLLEAATNNFKSEILGEGGFGCVYKAQLEDNLLVAVKRLDNQNISAIKEFQTEIDILSKIQHPNIISLLGYCVHDETKLLVYELMQNGSLETQLHGPSCGSNLTWHCRMKIALDTARGLEYLHEHCKPSLSDFGLAVMNGANTKNIKLSGTMGYAMPQLTDRSKLPSVIDPVIRDTMDLKHLYQVAAVAVLCVQPEPGYRPLITDVLHSLVPLVPVELGGTLRVAENRVAATLEP
ncbi:Concanavalin A-like lectin/glucanase, subgroup, partial [Cynara cardunculus var. scolymus]